ncbi:MAG: CBO2463/CBO2479 domain-containing protein [Clostridiaceae bacterium]
MENLKYISTERYVEGIITRVTDVSVSIDLKGRMGELKIPLRMLITDYELKVGLQVGFLMSYPEVLSGEVIEKENQKSEI